MTKFVSFLKNFGRNIAADPVTTLKGLVSLAAAGATVYGMATGKVPVNELSLGAASAMATSGLHALGSNTAAPAMVEQAIAVAPQIAAIANHYEGIRKEANTAQAALTAVTEGMSLLQQLQAKQAELKQ